MSEDREIVVRPLGIITQPNEKGQYPAGAQRTGANWIMRSPGVLENQFLATQLATVPAGTLYGLFSTRSQALQLVLNGATWGIHWVNAEATLPPVTSRVFSAVGRSNTILFRDRTIINPENADPLVSDYVAPSSTAQRAFRLAGLPQPTIDILNTSLTDGLAVEPSTSVTYGAHFVRRFADGYELTGPMSLFLQRENRTSTARRVDIRVYWPTGELVAGDVVKLYRSQAVKNSSTSAPDPGTTIYKVIEHTLTALNISDGFVELRDNAAASNAGGPLNGLGEECYSNPGQNGLGSSKFSPPVSKCMAVFNGRAIYANCRFPAKLDYAVRSGYGDFRGGATPEILSAGVGTRRFVGNATSGSPTVTGISSDQLVGVVPGQQIGMAGTPPFPFDGFVTVLSVGATSVTLSTNANFTSAAGIYNAFERISVNGSTATATSPQGIQLHHTFLRVETGRTVRQFGIITNFSATIRPQRYSPGTSPPAGLVVKATNGQNYDPPLPTWNETPLTIFPTERKNTLMWSEDQQPEAVPNANELVVGSGEIYALAPTRDAVWCFASDGLWRISGTFARVDGYPDIRVDMVDPTCTLSAPRAWCVLRDNVYAWTNRGIVEISDNGVRPLSDGVIGGQLRGYPWTETASIFLVADEAYDEIYAYDGEGHVWRYALRFNVWLTTSQYGVPAAACYYPPSRAVLFGVTGGALRRVIWNQGSREMAAAPVLEFQPIYGNRPDGLKQYIDATYIFGESSSSDLSVAAGFGSALVDQTWRVPTLYGDDRRASFGIGRNAPAIANSLTLWLIAQATGRNCYFSGVSVRYVPLTAQQAVRS